VTALSDEHAQVSVTEGHGALDHGALDHGALDIGDKVLLIPAHVDPAVNLYDRLFAWTGTGFAEWEVDGRRRYRLGGITR
jgi:D-serine deaminase-like pyridoxal phosphate-dependent protein